MTNTEFLRRSDYFSLLDYACIAIQRLDYCWKITSVYRYSSVVDYTHDAVLYLSDHSDIFTVCSSVYIERYTKDQFAIDIKFFKSFLSRLSQYQLDSLKVSCKCSHLLDYVLVNK